MDAYAERVSQLEAEGMTTSDAQGAADVEEAKGTLEVNLEGARMGKESKQGATRRHKLNDLGDCINCRQIAVDQDDPCKGKAGR